MKERKRRRFGLTSWQQIKRRRIVEDCARRERALSVKSMRICDNLNKGILILRLTKMRLGLLCQPAGLLGSAAVAARFHGGASGGARGAAGGGRRPLGDAV